jgi:DNA-binding SARP family transcriptional activator
MRFGVLGPLEVRSASGQVTIRGVKERRLLGLLLSRANSVVPVEDIIEGLWESNPPPSAAKSVQVYVVRVRKMLAPDGADGVVSRQGAGYVLHAPRDDVDALQFADLVAQAGEAAAEGTHDVASLVLRSALALWRGAPYADFQDTWFGTTQAAHLGEMRLTALEARIEADLALGRHAEVTAELESLVRENPLRERFWAQLMLALYRSGRQSDALLAFRRARDCLVEEIGVEPGPELQNLEQAILRHDPELGGDRAVQPNASTQPGAPPGTQPRPTLPSRRGPRRRRALIAAGVALVVVATALAALQHPALGHRVAAFGVDANAIAFVDPSRTALLGQTGTGGRPASVAAGFGRLWVTDPANRRVLVLNPATFRIEDQIHFGREPTGVAVSGGGIWVTDPGGGTVSEINPGSDTVVATVPVPVSPSAIAAGRGGCGWPIPAMGL